MLSRKNTTRLSLMCLERRDVPAKLTVTGFPPSAVHIDPPDHGTEKRAASSLAAPATLASPTDGTLGVGGDIYDEVVSEPIRIGPAILAPSADQVS